MENVKVTPAHGEGKIKANVIVTEGRMTALFTLKESNGKYYLNNPSKMVESLKGKEIGDKKHSGFIDQAYITDPDWIDQIKAFAMKETGLSPK